MTTRTVAPTPRPTVPEKVRVFAREQGVEHCLPGVIELSQRIFPSATHFEVFLEEDPEIADDRHILFRLGVRLDVPQSLEADQRWIEGLYRLCPKTGVCVFRLSLDLVA